MNFDSKQWMIAKVVLVQVVFLILHYAYDWFPNIFFSIFSGTGEAVYQHSKIGFYSYLIVLLIEYLIFKSKIEKKTDFVFAGLFVAIFMPWIQTILWYVYAAVVGPTQTMVIEIVMANIVLIFTTLTCHIIQKHLAETEFKNPMKILIFILLVVSIVEFTVFTFNEPWADLFAEPEPIYD
jgi:Family of unknown function (DUF6512)